MSSWNYRVARIRYPSGEIYGVFEQYYDDDGNPHGRSSPTDAIPSGDTVEELRSDLEHMMQALDEPVVDVELEPWELISEADRRAEAAKAEEERQQDLDDNGEPMVDLAVQRQKRHG